MSFSCYDEDGARTSHHTHCCIGARRTAHCATGDDAILVLYELITSLAKGGYVFGSDGLSVCLWTTLLKSYEFMAAISSIFHQTDFVTVFIV